MDILLAEALALHWFARILTTYYTITHGRRRFQAVHWWSHRSHLYSLKNQICHDCLSLTLLSMSHEKLICFLWYDCLLLLFLEENSIPVSKLLWQGQVDIQTLKCIKVIPEDVYWYQRDICLCLIFVTSPLKNKHVETKKQARWLFYLFLLIRSFSWGKKKLNLSDLSSSLA